MRRRNEALILNLKSDFKNFHLKAPPEKNPTQKPYGIADKIRSWSEKSRFSRTNSNLPSVYGLTKAKGGTCRRRVLYKVCPQQGDLRLLGPLSGRGTDGGARTRDRKVPADLRADSQATVPPTPLHVDV
ncbi:hypothetical protein PoB_002234700 [Plakobranchus ocellatus]|uniref:Uncharacterized protein n=1 Tax=Plakobranchus ocellatus TaxID=259542 RepID=A0AAV3ZMT5_9GAST|nr:hypothetical protein PoB_002234700 [Plakobranchus ocellatus]